MMRWFEWDSRELFDAWHDAKIQELNLPKLSMNQASGEIDATAQRTISYTTPHDVENKIIAMVENEHAEGLTETDLRLPEPPNAPISLA